MSAQTTADIGQGVAPTARSIAELREMLPGLPAMLTPRQVVENAILPMKLSAVYAAIRGGTFPAKVYKVSGRKMLISTASLFEALGVTAD